MITGLYTGIFAFAVIFLILNVVKQRRTNGVGLGDGNNEAVQRAVRIHGNFIEIVPLVLLAMLLLELQNFPALIIHAIGMMLVISRILHYWGLRESGGVSKGRFWGTFMAIIIFGIVGVLLCGRFIFNLIGT